MFASKKFFSHNRSIAYALTILLALTAATFGFYMVGIGMVYGVAASAVWVILSEGDDMPLGLAVLIVLGGAVLWAAASVLAFQRGVPLAGLAKQLDLSRIGRQLPFISTVAMVAGVILVAAQLIGRLSGPADSQ